MDEKLLKENVDKFIHRLITDKPSNREEDPWNQGFNQGWIIPINPQFINKGHSQ